MDADHLRRIRAGASRQAKASAEHRTCPSCHRKGALGAIQWFDDEVRVPGERWGVRVCRWCKYERAV